MEKLTNFLGIAGVAGGFCFILVQGINFLIKGAWESYSLYWIAENWGLEDKLAAYPDILSLMEKIPLSLAIIVAGMLFLWIASRLRNA